MDEDVNYLLCGFGCEVGYALGQRLKVAIHKIVFGHQTREG